MLERQRLGVSECVTTKHLREAEAEALLEDER